MEYLFRNKDGHQFFKEKKDEIVKEIDTLSKIELESSDDSLARAENGFLHGEYRNELKTHVTHIPFP